MAKFLILKQYIDKNKYRNFTNQFAKKQSRTLVKSDIDNLDSDEQIIKYMNVLLPTKTKTKYYKAQLDNPPRQTTPRNIELYKTEIDSKGMSIVSTIEDGVFYKADGEYSDIFDVCRDYNINVEPIKVSNTVYKIIVIGNVPYDSPDIPDGGLYLRVEIDYKEAKSDWESYLLVSYQKYLEGDYNIARLLAFVSFESLIRYCRNEVKNIVDSIQVKDAKLADLIVLEDINRSLGNEHMRLINKLEELLDIFYVFNSQGDKNYQDEKKSIVAKFKKLERFRNKVAHGKNKFTQDNNYKEFLDTLIIMNNFISLILFEDSETK